jgi:hypothetical protein
MFYFLTSKLLLDFIIIIIIITLIFVVIITIQLLPLLLRCYKLPCFVLCVCFFLSFTRAHFMIGPWAVELART